MKKITPISRSFFGSAKKTIANHVKLSSDTKTEEGGLLQATSSYINKNMINEKSRRFCLLTGRERGHYSKIKFARSQIRDLVNLGLISGLRKSS